MKQPVERALDDHDPVVTLERIARRVHRASALRAAEQDPVVGHYVEFVESD